LGVESTDAEELAQFLTEFGQRYRAPTLRH
jgi:hypothetical protein